MTDDGRRNPIALRAGELADVVGGQLVAGRFDAEAEGVAIDSRRVRAGDLFVAIRGDRFDGHAFVGEAVRRGAVGLVVSDVSVVDLHGTPTPRSDRPFVIAVAETIQALQRMGQFVRRESGARVVAITGSVGKTTTKELAATLLASAHDVVRNEGNLNNHIGLPLSLLGLRRRPDIAVVELGMNHAGELRTLVGIAEPEIRVWTNVAEVHSVFFDSIEAIADAKAEIMEGADAETHLIANAADMRVMARVSDFPGRLTTFGVEAEADVRATNLRCLGLDGMEATVHTPAGSNTLRTSLLGEGNVANILAAIAVALQFQVPLDALIAQLAECRAQPRRGQVRQLGPVTVVDDSYNSNPLALERALTAIGASAPTGRRVAVLGEMLELGARSDDLHRECGQLVASAGVELLVVVGGKPMRALADAAIAAGLPSAAVLSFTTSDDASDEIGRLVRPGDVVLVKGSRGIGTDRVVDRLAAELG